MSPTTVRLPGFDGAALTAALDAERGSRGLRWTGLANSLWIQSELLNQKLADDAVCPGALQRTVVRGSMTCQYALLLPRWLKKAPEDFLTEPGVQVGDTRLPNAGPDRRLRFDLPELYAALDARRRELDMSWVALGAALDCSPSRLTNLRTGRQAGIDLVMLATQWLRVPAARFVHAAT